MQFTALVLVWLIFFPNTVCTYILSKQKFWTFLKVQKSSLAYNTLVHSLSKTKVKGQPKKILIPEVKGLKTLVGNGKVGKF